MEQQKTGRQLTIPLHPALLPVLEDTGWRAAKKDGGQWTTDHFLAAWNRAMEDKKGTNRPARITSEAGRIFHSLRKNATVHLAEVFCTTHEITSITGMRLPIIEHYTKAFARGYWLTRR